jgi:hypothetical protein
MDAQAVAGSPCARRGGSTGLYVATGATISLGPYRSPVAVDHKLLVASRGLSSAHLARFAAALSLLVAISLYGVVLDNRELAVSRKISLQTFRADQLEAREVELRLQVQQLQTPERLRSMLREGEAARVTELERGNSPQRRGGRREGGKSASSDISAISASPR